MVKFTIIIFKIYLRKKNKYKPYSYGNNSLLWKYSNRKRLLPNGSDGKGPPLLEKKHLRKLSSIKDIVPSQWRYSDDQ